jgi:8-oxo-dGTP pyrophosphatase MutT (NUDIX family)
VLVLLGRDPATGPDVLLQQRARGLRDHPGQVSFPGGSWEAGDTSPVETALREAVEETGLDPTGVDPVAMLPRLFIPPSGFEVTGVVGHWREPSPVTAVDRAENAAVMRVPLARLADPGNRLTVRSVSGWEGPAFALPGMVIWGYTGEILNAVLRAGGWELPWTRGPAQDLDRTLAAVGGG